MSTSPSDYDMSDTSSSGASYMTNSPLHQGPQLTTNLSEESRGTKPFLRIIEQPQQHYRFRYISELAHGCLLGRSVATDNTKNYPSVELVNYTDKALIRCTLAQHNNSDEHPHKLHDDETDRDVSYIVPEGGSYMVGFRGIGIIHIAQKEIPKKNKKRINSNIVRLKFSAHHVQTGEELCAPVFSEPIHNSKSAATNILKIVRSSRSCGSPSGGDDVFIFVEKVNKKHVKIRFFELDEARQRIWEGVGQFTPSDVHHQYAIAFRTPPYKDRNIAEDVTVFMELVRTTDGHTSEPVEFKYKADEFYKHMKRRKLNLTYERNKIASGTFQQIPVASASYTYDIPVSVVSHQQAAVDTSQFLEPSIRSSNEYSHETFLNQYENAYATTEATPIPISNPMWGSESNTLQATGLIPYTDMNMNDQTYEILQNWEPQPLWESMKEFADEYIKNYNDLENRILENIPSSVVSDSGIASCIQFESGTVDDEAKFQGCSELNIERAMGKLRLGKKVDAYNNTLYDVEDSVKGQKFSTSKGTRVEAQMCPTPIVVNRRAMEHLGLRRKVDEYKAFYKAEDGVEAKKLIQELCKMIKDKSGFKKQEIREHLEMLFEKRLSNGDTFLHMSLYSDLNCVYSIVNIISTVKATHLLNYCNDKLQTPLHLAILLDMPVIASLLVAKGADPMLKDARGYNAIHYAVKFSSLFTLLQAIQENKVACNINEYNNEKQSALHMAVIEDSGPNAYCLLQFGASYSIRDEYGRTPLHLAAYDDSLEVTKALLDFIPMMPTKMTPFCLMESNKWSPRVVAMIISDIDVTDNFGNTALQIVCGGTVRDNSVMIASLLLEKKANPMKSENGNESAWGLVKNKPALKAILWDYIPAEFKDEYETDDDVFLSADEGDSCDDVTST